jgi:hypothetical protein
LLAEAPNWSRRSSMTLEALAADPRIAGLLQALRSELWPG